MIRVPGLLRAQGPAPLPIVPVATWEYQMGPARPYRPRSELVDVLNTTVDSVFGPESRVVVTSGSNIDHHGTGEALPRHGSNRHETGMAADFTIYRPDGSVVDPDDPDAVQFMRQAAANGILGIGAGDEYMGNAFHMDMVQPGVGQGHFWGSDTQGVGGELVAAMRGSGVQGVPGGTGGGGMIPQGQPAGGLLTATSSSRNPEAPQERRGLLGGLLSRDRLDHLALALEGMTLNPNVGLMNALGARIQNRREDERTAEAEQEEAARRERVAAWLQTVNPQLAAAYAANPEAENAVMGAALQAMMPQEPQAMTRIVTGADAAALGLDPERSYNITQGPNGIEASQIGGGSTEVNVFGDQVQDAYIEGATDAAVERHNAILVSAAEQSALLGDLQTMAQLAEQFDTGFGANAMATLGPLAQRLGIEVDGLEAAEAYRAIQDRLAPRMRVPGSGATSDTEVRMFLNALPNLSRSPEGNAIINQTLQNIARHQQQAAEIVRRAQRGEISWQDADQQIAALGTPYEAFNQFNGGGASNQGGTNRRVFDAETGTFR